MKQQDAFMGWRGRSPMTGDDVALIFTGRSVNEKTGPMVQAWLLVWDVAPLEAVRRNLDAAVCGGCVMRGGAHGKGRTCYVNLFAGGPSRIWGAMRAGKYPLLSPDQAADRLAGEHVRVTAYGDPAVLPVDYWQTVLAQAAGWVGYTHFWRWVDPAFRAICMASVNSPGEAIEAARLGWRTFRVRRSDDPVLPSEIVCPASEEGGHRTTCARCQLCRGTSRPAKQIAILYHGRKPGVGRGGYNTLMRQLEAGMPAVVSGTQRDQSRVRLALRQRLVRHGRNPRHLSQRMLADGRLEFRLTENRGDHAE